MLGAGPQNRSKYLIEVLRDFRTSRPAVNCALDKGEVAETTKPVADASMTTPLARELLIRARVIELRDAALAGAKINVADRGQLFSEQSFADRPKLSRPRPKPILILPSDARLMRRMLAGRVWHRPS